MHLLDGKKNNCNEREIMKALLLIDIQEGFNEPMWGERNNPLFEEIIQKLLDFYRTKNLPVIHVKHNSTDINSPLHLNNKGNQFMAIAQPQGKEPIFEKTVNSAFIGTDLDMYLRKNDIKEIVIVGLTTDHCVSTTTRMAGNLGYNVYVVEDGTATFGKIDHRGRKFSAEEIHTISLVSLFNEFAHIISAKELFKKIDK